MGFDTIKEIPKDVILVLGGIFSAVLFAWTQQSCIYTQLDFNIYWGTIVGLIGIPLLYSSYVIMLTKKVK